MKTNVEKGLLMARVVVIGAIALLVWLLVDQWFYGEVTFVLWNFIGSFIVSVARLFRTEDRGFGEGHVHPNGVVGTRGTGDHRVAITVEQFIDRYFDCN